MSTASETNVLSGLNADEQLRHKGELIYPNLFLSLAREHVTYYILHAKGPGKTRIDCHFLFEPHEIELTDFDPSDAVDFWHLVNRQDWAICERVQQGVVWLQGMGHLLGCPELWSNCYPCLPTILLPMYPDRTRPQ